MLDTIPVPAQSKFGAAVARRLNSLRPIAPAGSLARSGQTGTGFAPLPANLRDRRGGSAVLPRQFDLRARVESRVNGDSKEYRLVVEFYHSTDDAVSLSGKSVSYTGGQQTISAGWNDLYTSSWSSDLDESKQYYLNVWIGAELDEDGKWTGFSTNDTRWWISDTQTSHVHSTSGNMARFRHGYLLGSVVAENSLTSVTQKFDGPLMFLDFVELGRSGGGGSGSDISGTTYPMPFQFVEGKIKNNVFYFDGVFHSLPDIQAPIDGSVYLVIREDEDGGRTFEVSLSPGAAPSGGSVTNYTLYVFTGGKVAMDYRTTFMALFSKGVTANEKSGLTVEDGEIDIDGREEDDAFGIRTMTVKGEDDAEDKTVKFIGTEDVEIKPVPENFGPHTLTVKTGDGEDDKKEYQILSAEDVEIETKPKTDCVESLNGETGDLEITGGHKVNVSKDGKTIVVSLDESKEDPKPDPNTNCGDHPGSEEGGGVEAGGAWGGGSGGAGVPAEGGAGSSGVGCDC